MHVQQHEFWVEYNLETWDFGQTIGLFSEPKLM